MCIFTVHNEVAKLMFLQASVCPQGECLPQCMLQYHTQSPGSRHPPGTDTPMGAGTTPLKRRPLLQTVCILLECILVVIVSCNKIPDCVIEKGFIVLSSDEPSQTKVSNNSLCKLIERSHSKTPRKITPQMMPGLNILSTLLTGSVTGERIHKYIL